MDDRVSRAVVRLLVRPATDKHESRCVRSLGCMPQRVLDRDVNAFALLDPARVEQIPPESARFGKRRRDGLRIGRDRSRGRPRPHARTIREPMREPLLRPGIENATANGLEQAAGWSLGARTARRGGTGRGRSAQVRPALPRLSFRRSTARTARGRSFRSPPRGSEGARATRRCSRAIRARPRSQRSPLRIAPLEPLIAGRRRGGRPRSGVRTSHSRPTHRAAARSSK